MACSLQIYIHLYMTQFWIPNYGNCGYHSNSFLSRLSSLPPFPSHPLPPILALSRFSFFILDLICFSILTTFYKFKNIIYWVWESMHAVYVDTHIMTCMGRSEDTFAETILFFHLYIGFRRELRFPDFHCKWLYQLNHLASPLLNLHSEKGKVTD